MQISYKMPLVFQSHTPTYMYINLDITLYLEKSCPRWQSLLSYTLVKTYFSALFLNFIGPLYP